MEALLNDLKFGARMLARTPGFTLVALVTIALGIGANTAIFSVVNAVLLRPLPFPDPERLAMVSTTNLARGFTNFGTSMPDFRAWRERNTTFEKMAAYSTTNFNISGTIEPERVTGARVSTEMFPLLGAGPIRGRSFTNDEGIFGKHHVAIISDGLWQRRFGPDAGLTDPDGEACSEEVRIFTRGAACRRPGPVPEQAPGRTLLITRLVPPPAGRGARRRGACLRIS